MSRYFALLIGATMMLGACSSSNAPTAPSKQINAPAAPSKQITSKATPPAPAIRKEVVKYNGPFGLKMGLTRAQAEALISDLKAKPDNPMWSSASTVPLPHPYFESYSLQFSKKSGLCAIVGVGKDIISGSTGTEIRTQFDSLDEALTSKYGTGKKYDFSSERYSSPEYWMLQLLQKNQVLAKLWSKQTKATLDNNISSILIDAHASNISTGYINIRYEFDNIDDCATEEKAKTNEAL